MTHGENGDLQPLAVVDWPRVPCKGDTIMLSGPEFGEGDSQFDDETVFEVLDVYFKQAIGKDRKPEADENGVPYEPTIQVFVVEPPATTCTFVPLCTCDEGMCVPSPENRERCESCNGRLGRRHHQMIAQREARKTSM